MADRAEKLKAMVADRAWENGGSDLSRLVFEVLEERADLLAALERANQGVINFEPGRVIIDSGAWSFAVGILRAHQGEGTLTDHSHINDDEVSPHMGRMSAAHDGYVEHLHPGDGHAYPLAHQGEGT